MSLLCARKIGVCGSSKGLDPHAIAFCQALGRRLAQDPLARIISGGTKQRHNARPNDFAADWWIIDAAQQELDSTVIPTRILTVVRDPAVETTGFQVGALQRARGKTSEARRIAFVRDIDGLIAVAGGRGTDQELALAIEHDIKVLPVPTFGGTAKKYWDVYRADLIKTLRLNEDVVAKWEGAAPTEEQGLRALADSIVEALFGSFPRRCFIIMPYRDDYDSLYDFVIAPALRAIGDQAIRLDRVGMPGNITTQIEEGIKNCDYAIAVLDQLRPNVLYELGLAHGRHKTTILMNLKGALGGDGMLPFDVSTLQRLEYAKVDAGLQTRLQSVLETLTLS